MSDERLRVDFDACVTLYQDYIRQTAKGKPNSSVNISELKTSGGKRKSEAIEDRYYTKEEYAALSPEQKKELASKRLKRGHKPGAKDSKVKGAGNKKSNTEVIKNLKAMNRQVSQLAKQMSKAGVDDDKTTASSNTESSVEEAPAKKKPKAGSNRTNSALTRQKKTPNESK